MSGKRQRGTCFGTAISAAVLLFAGCSDDTPNEFDRRSLSPMATSAVTETGHLATPIPSSSVVSPVLSAAAPTPLQEAALDAYRQMWAAMLTAAESSDPDAPGLASYATGEALAKLRYSLTADQQHGLVSKGQLRITPEVAAIVGTTAKINDCADDSEWLRYNRDGSLKAGPPGGRRQVAATATIVDGRWKVAELRIDGVGTC